jgi:hypothetical protein
MAVVIVVDDGIRNADTNLRLMSDESVAKRSFRPEDIRLLREVRRPQDAHEALKFGRADIVDNTAGARSV